MTIHIQFSYSGSYNLLKKLLLRLHRAMSAPGRMLMLRCSTSLVSCPLLTSLTCRPIWWVLLTVLWAKDVAARNMFWLFRVDTSVFVNVRSAGCFIAWLAVHRPVRRQTWLSFSGLRSTTLLTLLLLDPLERLIVLSPLQFTVFRSCSISSLNFPGLSDSVCPSSLFRMVVPPHVMVAVSRLLGDILVVVILIMADALVGPVVCAWLWNLRQDGHCLSIPTLTWEGPDVSVVRFRLATRMRLCDGWTIRFVRDRQSSV